MRFFNYIKSLLWKKEAFAAGAFALTATTFVSYLTGLLRDRIFAQSFGAGIDLDVYNASFIVPDILFNILISGSFSAAFIPMFSSLLSQGAKEKAQELANNILNAACIAIFVTALAAFFFMPYLAPRIAPGFSTHDLAHLISFSRLMLISPLIMTISSSFGAMLISYKKFLPYGLSPIFYNLGIVGGALTTRWFGLYGLVFGTLFGAFLHTLPRLAAIRKSEFRYRPMLKLRDKNFIAVVKMLIPKMVGQPVEQLTFLGFTRIATLLAAGSVTAVSFARNFQSVPVSLFGISFSVAMLPTLAECAARSDRTGFVKNFSKVFRDVLIFTVPIAVGILLFNKFIIGTLLGGRNFTEENILRTASVLAVFAFSIPTESLIHLFARSFYALKNTILPVVMSVIGGVISVAFAWHYAQTLGITAIPYGFFLGSATEMALLGILLYYKLKVVGK